MPMDKGLQGSQPWIDAVANLAANTVTQLDAAGARIGQSPFTTVRRCLAGDGNADHSAIGVGADEHLIADAAALPHDLGQHERNLGRSFQARRGVYDFIKIEACSFPSFYPART